MAFIADTFSLGQAPCSSASSEIVTLCDDLRDARIARRKALTAIQAHRGDGQAVEDLKGEIAFQECVISDFTEMLTDIKGTSPEEARRKLIVVRHGLDLENGGLVYWSLLQDVLHFLQHGARA